MVNVPCYSMGTAPRSKLQLSPLLKLIVRESSSTTKLTPGPGAYTKVTLMHKLKAPNWV